MSDDVYIRLIREIEIEKGRMTTHEAQCTERQRRLDEKMDAFQASLNTVVAAVTKVDARGSGWKDKVLYATIAALFGFAAWAGGQLYNQGLERTTAAAHAPGG